MRPRVPLELTRAPLRTVRPLDLRSVYAEPSPQLARLVERGAVLRIAPGYYTVIPDDAGSEWTPTIEAAGLAVATAIFGQGVPVMMGVSAARSYGAVPRAVHAAAIATPRQHHPVKLMDGATVRFVKRDVGRLEARQVDVPDLGRGLVTTEEQTVLDLARSIDPALGEGGTIEAVRALMPSCQRKVLENIAVEQRFRATLRRVDRWMDVGE